MAVFLMKMRHSFSNSTLSALFGITSRTISKRLRLGVSLLDEAIVWTFLDSLQHDRQAMASNNTAMARSLFHQSEDDVCVIFDGTYRYCQASSNLDAAQRLYSGHKRRPLYKIMVGVAPNGRILYVTGKYSATRTDSTILRHAFERGTLHRLQLNDVILADMGFASFQKFIEQQRGENLFEVRTSHKSKVAGASIDEETRRFNESRCVSLVRWRVEQTFGIFKQRFHYFQNANFKCTTEDFRKAKIMFALMNFFFEDITKDNNSLELTERIVARMNKTNLMAHFVCNFKLAESNLEHFADFRLFLLTNIDDHSIAAIFPPQTENNDLIMLACGSYQLKQAKLYLNRQNVKTTFKVGKVTKFNSYFIDHFKLDSEQGETIHFIVGQVASTKNNTSSLTASSNKTFLLIDTSKAGYEAILEYYCTCPMGLRTVGCCIHVMAIVWFLGGGYKCKNETVNPNLNFLCDITASRSSSTETNEESE